ncbi:MAG: ferritin family protein [bacterium]
MSKIDDLLNGAMNAEAKAQVFYMDASNKAQSQAGKKLFKELADFEGRHYERVKGIIDMRNQGNALGTVIAPDLMPDVKSEIEGEVEPNKDEIVAVLNIAIAAEKDAQSKYREIADMIEETEGKAIFMNLAEEENKHQRILEDQFYHMSNKGLIIWE